MKERYAFRVSMKVENDTAEVMVYSSIASDKFWGDEFTPEDFDKQLKEAKKDGATKLNLRINSPGGDVFSAVAMRSMIINAEFANVRVMIEGLCASAATLFATVPGAHVVIADGSEFMIHNPMTIAWGNADEIEKTVEHLRSMEGTFHEMYAAKCGKDVGQIKEWMDETTWFTAKRAVEEGFCDELLETEKAVACVTLEDMAVMQAMYGVVPEEIQVAAETNQGSNENPVAGFSTSNKNKEEDTTMEIKDVTQEMLLAENPALVQEIRNQAVAEERDRIAGITDMTLPGFEADAEEAKANGASVEAFMKTCRAKSVAMKAAEKQKGADFITARMQETAPAANVAPGAAEVNDTTEEEEIIAEAKKNAALAAEMMGKSSGMF